MHSHLTFAIIQQLLKSTTSNINLLLPVIGITLFIILYILATLLYPGGHDHDKTSAGFSWVHNYWCELMAPLAQNNETNTARPVAITAMFILCLSLGIFFYRASRLFWPGSTGRRIVRSSGILSMITLVALLAGEHDRVINSSGILGMIAMVGTLIGLYKIHSYGLVWHGSICLLLVVVNNYIYYTGEFFYALAVIQKITFFLFLVWFIVVTIVLYKREKAFPDMA